jgi:hypothetical protein
VEEAEEAEEAEEEEEEVAARRAQQQAQHLNINPYPKVFVELLQKKEC